MYRPIVQDCGVKVCPVGPDNRSDFGIDSNTLKKKWITKRAVDVTFQHISQINYCLKLVVKAQAQ